MASLMVRAAAKLAGVNLDEPLVKLGIGVIKQTHKDVGTALQQAQNVDWVWLAAQSCVTPEIQRALDRRYPKAQNELYAWACEFATQAKSDPERAKKIHSWRGSL